MTEEERRSHAERLIQQVHSGYEFSVVYEHIDLEDASDEDQEAIHNLMHKAKISVTFE